MCKIILVTKYAESAGLWANLLRKNRMAGSSVSELLRRYQGFEGEMQYMAAPATNNISFLEESAKGSDGLILYLASDKTTIPLAFKNCFEKIGYDFGVCEEDKTTYSSIFNEILFGCVDDLVAFSKFLNRRLLFPDKSVGEQYAALHRRLLQEGLDVENDEDMKLYQVWRFRK